MKRLPFPHMARHHSAALLLVWAAAFCAGCRTPRPESVARTQELRALHEDRAVARRAGQVMAFRFRIKGRDAYATAALPQSGPDTQTALDFGNDAKAVFSSTSARDDVPVLGTAAWQRIAREVSAALAPPSPRECRLVTAADRELFICRDAAGTPGFFPLTQRPAGLKVTQRLSPAALVSRMAEALHDIHGPGPAVLLTGGEPPLLLLDPAGPRLTFLNTPAEEVQKIPLLGSSPDVTMRGLLSLSVRSGVLHTLKNPATTAVQGAANVLTSADAALYGLLAQLPKEPPPPVVARPFMDAVAWNKHLDRITGTRTVPATVKLRIGGDQFFPDLIQAVQEARDSIDILFYIWDTDDYAIQIADLLRERSHHVRVRVLIDEAACLQSALMTPHSPQQPDHRAPSSITEYLRRDSRIEVRPMAMSALTANHSKMVVIDGKRAWLGGMNIGREYRVDWHDMMAEVRGPLIGWMQRTFASTWAHQGWGGDAAAFYRVLRDGRKDDSAFPVPDGAFPVRPLRNSAVHADLRQSQIDALRRVQHSVWLENAYITDVRYIRELIKARHRGVDVRVVMPEENDNPLLKASNRALITLFRRHGIRVWLLPGMSHVKAAIYDGWATIGSANYDRLSLRVNTEFNIAYHHPPAVEALRRDLFLKDMARARELTGPPPHLPATGKIKDALLRLMAGQF
jgi:cardiolipin synthase A/B